jgi:uncharacterized protein YjbI with pentapeptide repeats
MATSRTRSRACGTSSVTALLKEFPLHSQNAVSDLKRTLGAAALLSSTVRPPPPAPPLDVPAEPVAVRADRLFAGVDFSKVRTSAEFAGWLVRLKLASPEVQARVFQGLFKQAKQAVNQGGDLNFRDLFARRIRELHRDAQARAAECARDHLQGVDLSGCNLAGAKLNGVDLNSTIISNANLEKADFTGARIEGCDFNGADLAAALLSNAVLHASCFDGADLSRAKLTGVMVGDTHGQPSSFRHVNLTDADLSGMDFTALGLGGLNLTRADLRGVRNFDEQLRPILETGSNLTDARLDGVFVAGLLKVVQTYARDVGDGMQQNPKKRRPGVAPGVPG